MCVYMCTVCDIIRQDDERYLLLYLYTLISYKKLHAILKIAIDVLRMFVSMCVYLNVCVLLMTCFADPTRAIVINRDAIHQIVCRMGAELVR